MQRLIRFCFLLNLCCFSACKSLETNSSTKVVNGNAATEGQFPSLLFLTQASEDTLKNCSGTKIGAQFILTAAHCFEKEYILQENLKLKLNVSNKVDNKNEYVSSREQIVEKIMVPDATKKYLKLNDPVFDFIPLAYPDIAIVKLRKETPQFAEFAKIPIARLNLQKISEGAPVTKIGFGVSLDSKGATQSGKLFYGASKIETAERSREFLELAIEDSIKGLQGFVQSLIVQYEEYFQKEPDKLVLLNQQYKWQETFAQNSLDPNDGIQNYLFTAGLAADSKAAAIGKGDSGGPLLLGNGSESIVVGVNASKVMRMPMDGLPAPKSFEFSFAFDAHVRIDGETNQKIKEWIEKSLN